MHSFSHHHNDPRVCKYVKALRLFMQGRRALATYIPHISEEKIQTQELFEALSTGSFDSLCLHVRSLANSSAFHDDDMFHRALSRPLHS